MTDKKEIPASSQQKDACSPYWVMTIRDWLSGKTIPFDSGDNREMTITDFRSVGFTDDAQNYPRDEISLVMFAAFNGVNVEKLPEAMRYFPNEATKKAWDRVAEAARAHIEGELK